MASVRAPTDSLNDSVMDGVSLGFVAKPQAQMAYCRWGVYKAEIHLKCIYIPE